jgi:RNA polymerase sigma factor (sigma-70 family)
MDAATARVEAARAGDPAALDAVVTEYLPLVYNIVRRSLRRSADVDDVVQETMLHLVRGMGTLRDPGRLRAWLVAITVNQIRNHQRSEHRAPASTPLDERVDIPDPRGEFVEHTLTQLDVSGQRRETQQAGQWLDPDQRELLALWWLEASGQLTRPELADALQADSHHVAVRVSRMKEQLDFSRRVVRALALTPRCRGLAEVAFDWDGDTSSVWRKRFVRHVRECPVCDPATSGLIPPELLLAGLALLPLPAALAAFRISGLLFEAAPTTTLPPVTSAPPGRHGGSHRRGGGKAAGKTTGMTLAKPIGVAFAAIVVVSVGAVVVDGLQSKQATVAITTTSTGSAITPTLAPSHAITPSAVAVPTHSASPSGPAHSSKPGVVASTTTAVVHTSAAVVAPTTAASTNTTSSSAGGTSSDTGSASAAQQVLDDINAARKAAGLTPYTMSTDLINSATGHNNLMADGCGLTHQCPNEAPIGDRETAAGVQWTAAGENIGDGGPVDDSQSAIAQMAVGLTNDMLAEQPPNDGHRLNILSSTYTEVGIAVTLNSSGTVYMTQDFAN